MSVTERKVFPQRGSVFPREIVLSGNVTIGAAGAISAQTDPKHSGVVWTKNAAAGRYDAVFYKQFSLFKDCSANMIKGDVAAFPTTTGTNPQFRTYNGSGAELQFTRSDTLADADAASGVSFTYQFTVGDLA